MNGGKGGEKVEGRGTRARGEIARVEEWRKTLERKGDVTERRRKQGIRKEKKWEMKKSVIKEERIGRKTEHCCGRRGRRKEGETEARKKLKAKGMKGRNDRSTEISNVSE